MNPDDLMLRLQYYKETGQTDEVQKYEQYLKETGQLKHPTAPTPAKRTPLIGVSGHPIVDASPETSYGQEALGGIASLLSNVPGGTALQAGARSLIRGQPYTEALSDIEGAEAAAPKWVRRGNSLLGGGMAAGVLPGGAVTQGFRYGALNGLLRPDDATLGDRLKSGAGEGAFGAVMGKAGQFLPALARTVVAKPLGVTSRAIKAAMASADAANYGRAASEGVASMKSTTPQFAVRDALNAPDIKPYVDAVRTSRTFQGADDPTVLREVYKLMGERQRLLSSRVLNSADYKAGSSLEKSDIGLAKGQLSDAADQVMPSFRTANQTHAELSGQREALINAADATNRITKRSSVAGKNLDKKSPEAFQEFLKNLSDAEASWATKGMLGRTKENIPLTVNPLKLFGIPKAAVRLNRMAPYLDQLDQLTGNNVPSIIRSGVIGASGYAGQSSSDERRRAIQAALLRARR